jgi:hypothetical protein
MRENVVAYFHFKWTKNRGAGHPATHGPEQLNTMLENHLPLFAIKKRNSMLL